MAESQRAASEPITLKKCLEAFTREEELGEDEKYYCSSCKSLQLAVKKLQIWRLPPILIVHLKRFHYLNTRWIKSHKIVDFPSYNLDPTDYLAAVPATTLKRYQSIKKRTSMVNGTITEISEPSSLSSLEKEGELENKSPILDGVGAADVFGEEGDDEEDQAVPPTTFSNSSSAAAVFSPSFGRRKRQESTSLVSHPIKDDNLQDFHKHKLVSGADSLVVKYNLYSMVVSLSLFYSFKLEYFFHEILSHLIIVQLFWDFLSLV